MAPALTPLLLAAAAVLCAAGLTKLREPGEVTAALDTLGLPARLAAAAALGSGEIALGLWVAVSPTRLACALLGLAYASFAVVALVLARRRAACGCFGADEAPASSAGSLISVALAAVGLLAAGAEPLGLRWILERPPGTAVAVLVGTAGLAYALVLAYTQLPRAWAAWSAP